MKTPPSLPLLASLALATQLTTAEVTFHEITGDADSGISSDKTYTHAIDFGTSGTATVNGVVFANEIGVLTDGRANAGTRTYGPNNHPGSNPPAVVDTVESIFRDMRFNGPDPSYVELTGLTSGEWYEFRFYERAWDAGAIRTYSLNFDTGADGSVEFSTVKINQNDSTLPAPGFAANVSYALSYKYQADANGSLRVTVDLADDHNGSYHLYGLTNEVDPDGGSNYLVSLDNNTFSSGDPQATLVGSLAGSFEGGPDPSTFSLVAGNGDTDNGKFQINGDRLEVGNFDFTGVNSVNGQQYSVRVQGVGSGTAERSILLTVLKDDDSDNLLDDWETAWASNLTDLSGAIGTEDFDLDGLTDLQEFQISIGTFGGGVPAYIAIDPTKKDTDDDTLEDGQEINPTAPRVQTDPTNGDTDLDGLPDAVETNSGTFTDANDTGSNPTLCDTDGDFATDSWEVTYSTDPNNAGSTPGPIGPVAVVPITDDASTGLDPAKTYTHLVSGGQATTVNGVTFEALNPAGVVTDFTWDTLTWLQSQVLANPGDWDPVGAGVSANVESLLNSFTYSGTGANPGSSQRFTLSNLTQGATYDLRLYSRMWDDNPAASGRPSDLVLINGAEVVQPYSAMPLDRPGLITGSTFDNDAYYLSYQYVAQTTELVIEATVPVCAPVNSGSFHLYALSNEIASGAPLGQILITNQLRLGDGSVAIAFKAKSQTTYQVTKSSNLVGAFSPLNVPLSVTTDINGDGQAIIPAAEASDLKEFYRIEE